ALPDGAEVRYRALMTGPGFSVTSDIRTVRAGDAPQPDSVTVAGSLNVPMGCAEPWQPSCEQAMMTLDPADKIWRLTVDLPAGPYEYKAALNGTWDENYGVDGQFNGANIVLNHPGGPVTFRYDNSTHLITAVYASQQPGAVSVPGSLNSEIGCAADWDPACDQAQLALDPADMVWKLSVANLPAG
ncbi:pullulanase X25 domain-containing protein, partial [Escherichia coli]|uniref:pullulanase X25 domain-containing protein n=1 Tax=Escherichia coli TaxID=562 RepID=UPI0032E4807B